MNTLLILNFTHQLTAEQQQEIKRLTGATIAEVRDIPVQIGPIAQDGPLAEQVARIVDAAGLTPSEWQARRFLITSPAYAPASAAVLAEVHGRCGHFPEMISLERVSGGYAVAEVVDLQAIRDRARQTR